jgi:soluble lytic murein transglycosylase-like protein
LRQAGKRRRAPRKQREERLLSELSVLKQRITDIESQRDAERRSRNQPPVPQTPSTANRFARQFNLTMMAAACLLLLGALASATNSGDGYNPAVQIRQSTTLANDTTRSTSGKSNPAGRINRATDAQNFSQTLQAKIRRLGYGFNNRPAHQQWGPPLLAAGTQDDKPAAKRSYDPVVKQLQKDLLYLGFDLGQASADGLNGLRTEQALDEFRALYLSAADAPKRLESKELAFLLGVYANLAREDAGKFNIDRGVLAAIRFSSVRTGVDFSYLLELAAAESAFDPVAQAGTSSALGLYQFTHDTWLDTIKVHGEKYGLGGYASQIEYFVNRAGNRRPKIQDDAVYKHVLELRKNPRVSAMMAAESVKDNLKRLASLDSEPGRTELYLTHFFGPDDAISFLKVMDENPGTFAVDVFPEAAQSNHSIFHPETCKPRTITEVYEVFSEKFHNSRYGEWSLN